MHMNRIISSILTVFCILLAFRYGPVGTLHLTVTILVIPLGCIWYGKEIGSMAGSSPTDEGGTGRFIGKMITFSGWILLLFIMAVLLLFARR